jgi:hypothetical protein
MKKYDVYFYSREQGEKDKEVVKAESHKDALEKYLVGKNVNNFKMIVVDAKGFFDPLASSQQLFKNPLYKNDEIVGNCDHEKQLSDSEDNISNSFYATSSLTKNHSEKLDKLIELQEKQLFWIRFFGVITVISMVFAFFYVILVMNSGYRRY